MVLAYFETYGPIRTSRARRHGEIKVVVRARVCTRGEKNWPVEEKGSKQGQRTLDIFIHRINHCRYFLHQLESKPEIRRILPTEYRIIPMKDDLTVKN